MTGRKSEPEVEAPSGGAGWRRRWTPAEKMLIVREALEPGMSVSLVARRNRINPNQLSRWRKLYREGRLTSVAAGEPAVPVSELASAMSKIRELERLLRRKTLENAVLREAVELARDRRWWTDRVLLLPRDEN